MKKLTNYLSGLLAIVALFSLVSCEDEKATPIDPPTAEFSSEASTDLSGTVTFTNTSLEADSYLWDFGDGTGTSIEENPVYVYAEGGTYTVKLIAVNAGGGDTAKVDVTVVTEMPNLVIGGDMSNESAWTFRQMWVAADNAVDHTFVDGEFIFANAADTRWSNSILWQEIALEADKTYKFNLNIRNAEGVAGIWFEVLLGKQDPASTGEDYGDGGNRTKLECADTAFDEDIVVLRSSCATETMPIANDGTFTLTANELTDNGTVYLVFKSGTWDSNYGTGLYIDNASIVEVP